MAKRSAQIRLTGRFPVGTTVELREVAPGALPGGPPMGAVVTRAKTNKRSVTVFEDGVIEGRRYQATAEIDGELRAVTVTGKVPPDDREKQERPEAGVAGALRDPGGRDDFDAAVASEEKRLGAPADGLIAPGNMPRQDAAHDAGVVQRSATPMGEATPKDRHETVPYLDQRDYADGDVVQRSDTEVGMATPIPDVPRTQAEAREAGIVQASATPVGEATPIRGGGPLRSRLAADSPEEASGDARVDPAEAEEASPADPEGRSRDELLELAARYEVQDADKLEDAQLAAVVLERESAAGIDVVGRSVEDVEDDDGPTKAVLLERARELNIQGRSKMSKAELAEAIDRAE